MGVFLLGVIFTGGEAPSSRAIKKELEGLDMFCVAADSGLELAESAGIRLDLIVGDMDSLSDSSRLDSYPAQRVIRHDTWKDFTDTELAFKAALEKSCREIWIIGGGGGRIDHLFALRSMFERELFPLRWLTADADIYCLDHAVNRELSFSAEQDALVSVFPLGGGPWEAESGGLKWSLNKLPWNRGFFGLSNIAVDGKFNVKAVSGRFMIIIPLENACRR
jgi:thiamine pyrophosphokinase